MTNSVVFDFDRAAVLVTGGTSGIGHAVASAFADAGAEVVVTGTRPSSDDYDTDLKRFSYRSLQLTDPESVAGVVESIERLDILVNNAGANFPGGRDEWDPDAFADSLVLNLAGAMRLTMGCRARLAASSMDGGSSVVNLVSMAAYRAVPMVPGYGAAKSGLLSLTKNLAIQWIDDGIRVNAVAPGLIDTPMTAPMQLFPDLLDHEMRHVPAGRMGTPDEVASAVLFLASAVSAYTTGTVLAVDGGYLAV